MILAYFDYCVSVGGERAYNPLMLQSL